MTDDVFELMARQWGSPVVARAEIFKFTGGAVSSKYCANQDSLGFGIPNRFKIGRRVVYRVDELVAWLKEHSRSV